MAIPQTLCEPQSGYRSSTILILFIYYHRFEKNEPLKQVTVRCTDFLCKTARSCTRYSRERGRLGCRARPSSCPSCWSISTERRRWRWELHTTFSPFAASTIRCVSRCLFAVAGHGVCDLCVSSKWHFTTAATTADINATLRENNHPVLSSMHSERHGIVLRRRNIE